MTPILASMFEHMAWANDRVLRLLESTPHAAAGDVLRWLAHVVAAERVWLLRLRGEDSSTQAIWPNWSLADVRATAADNREGFHAWFAAASVDDVNRMIDYRNSQGVAFRTSAADILTHVALHGSYHRGQIAAALRADGVAPVGTDYILFVRERPSPVGSAA